VACLRRALRAALRYTRVERISVEGCFAGTGKRIDDKNDHRHLICH
jgi:hypothetical protein